MYTLKGFFAFSPLVNNALNAVAKYGEISNNSLTYAKDKLIYANDAAKQTTFISFHSVGDNGKQTVPQSVADNALKLGQFLYNRGIAGQIPSNPAVLNQQVNAEFNTTLKNFTCGVIENDGFISLPEWVSYNDLTFTGQNVEVTIWLSDASFSSQYPEYEIEVIPPITPLDDFFKDPVVVVKPALDRFSIVKKLDEVQVKRAQYPYTQIQGLDFDYQNPKDANYKLPTHWITIIYGQAGNNPDLVRQAIVDYVLKNSTHTQTEWATVIPDLFKTTEFIIAPLWQRVAMTNADYQGGIFSPTVKPATALAYLKKVVKGTKYTDAWITAQHELSSTVFRSLALAIVGNPDNKGGLTQFSDKFKDYILVTNGSGDFNRMSTLTQEFVTLMLNLIKVAETFTMFSPVPVGMARVVRSGVVYISAYYENVNYLVVAKPSAETL